MDRLVFKLGARVFDILCWRAVHDGALHKGPSASCDR